VSPGGLLLGGEGEGLQGLTGLPLGTAPRRVVAVGLRLQAHRDLQHAAHAGEGGVGDQAVVGAFFGHGGAELGIAEAAITAELPAEVGACLAVEGVIERAAGFGKARPAHRRGSLGCG
jgi:hypothetical protein